MLLGEPKALPGLRQPPWRMALFAPEHAADAALVRFRGRSLSLGGCGFWLCRIVGGGGLRADGADIPFKAGTAGGLKFAIADGAADAACLMNDEIVLNGQLPFKMSPHFSACDNRLTGNAPGLTDDEFARLNGSLTEIAFNHHAGGIGDVACKGHAFAQNELAVGGGGGRGRRSCCRGRGL